MPKKRKKLNPAVKRQIVEEAGNKCANPGCANWRVHIHHIKHWAIYESDEPGILVAVYPSCHDAIHHGSLEFSNDILYLWKAIKRPAKPNFTHVYIEPSIEIKLLTGSISISTKNDNVTVFELSEYNKLSFRILDGDIALINLNICDLKGVEKIKISDNNVRIHDADTLLFEKVPGHVKISTKNVYSFIPPEFASKMRVHQPGYLANDDLILLEILVMKPGHVRVNGCWSDSNRAVVITDKSISFMTHNLQRPLSLIGEGEASVLMYAGPIDRAMFGLEDSDAGALKV